MRFFWFGFITLFALLSGCSTAPIPTESVYIPPTVAVTLAPTSAPSPTIPAPTATPSCTNALRFVSDISIPDGTLVIPNSTLDKRWQVENVGSCSWDGRYRLKLIAGFELGAAPEQMLYPARSDSEAMIRIEFTAPTEPGLYRSAWQAHDPLGQPFGDPIFIEVIVQ